MKTTATNNIISNDGGKERRIREFVEAAKETGICYTKFVNEVVKIWKSENGSEDLKDFVLEVKRAGVRQTALTGSIERIWTGKEEKSEDIQSYGIDLETVAEKVEHFLDYYKVDLIEVYNSQQKSQDDWITDEDSFITKYYYILFATYIVFEKNGKVNKNEINRTLDELLGLFTIHCDIPDMSFLRRFICRLNFVGQDIPVITQNVGQQLYHKDGYKQLKCEYKPSTNIVFETSLAMIWLIDTYF